jgi:hypothetical protein
MDNAWRIVKSYGDFIPNTMGYLYNHQNMISYMVDIAFPLWLVKILHVNQQNLQLVNIGNMETTPKIMGFSWDKYTSMNGPLVQDFVTNWFLSSTIG